MTGKAIIIVACLLATFGLLVPLILDSWDRARRLDRPTTKPEHDRHG